MKALLVILCLLYFHSGYAQASALRRLPLVNQVEDQSELSKGENADEKIKKNFFLKADVSKTSCFVGEAVMATFKAYSRMNANLRVNKRPALTGFSVMEMVDSYSNDPEVEVVNGNAYNTHLIRKVQLFPLQEGVFELEPAQVDSRIFLRNPNMVKYLSLETPRIAITVKPLPTKNQPDSFSGAVGKFSISLQMASRDLDQYDPAAARLTISGSGNFPLITDPDIMWPKGIDVSGPQVTEDLNKYAYPLSGSKSFEYHLDTHLPGTYTIDSISFSYFDPGDAKYKTVRTQAIHFTVKKGAKKKNFTDQIVNNPEGVPIHYYYFGVIVLGILGWIIFQLIRSRKSDSK